MTKRITDILISIGEDPSREGLLHTPARVERMFGEIFAGYKQNPADIFTTFDSGSYDQLVILKDIEVFSMCEHHLLPFYGKAHIGYLPDKKIVGISKLARLLDIFSKRLQIQERICEQVTSALMTYLEPKGAICIIEATHLCMRMRGVAKQNSTMVTSSIKGCFLENEHIKQEFLNLIK